jgi:broad specificity phosphatase PhoE
VTDAGGPLIPDGLDATIVFLRHGESVYITEGRFQGQADTPLSALGERQARLAAGRLAAPARSPVLPIPARPPLEIVHSPLARTARTAHLVAEAIVAATGTSPPSSGPSIGVAALPAEASPTSPPGRMRSDRGFLEIGQGAWEGLTRTEIEARYADVLAAWRRTPVEANAPGGERLVEVRARVEPSLRALLARLAAEPAGDRAETTAAGFPPVAAADTPWTLLVAHDGVFKVTLLTLLDLPLERFWAFPFAMCGISVLEIRDGRAVLRAHNLTEHLAPLLDEVAVGETEQRQRSGAL